MPALLLYMTERAIGAWETRFISPLGPICLAAEGDFLIGCWFEGQKYDRQGLPEDIREGDSPALQQAAVWLDAYFHGLPLPEGPKLNPRGTDFQLRVWRLLSDIPYGETVTYGKLASELSKSRGGRATSARAVGAAVGRNPLSLFLPCHRVVGAKGELTGYAGGLDRKAALLQLEQGKLSFWNEEKE